jgi:enamine deaminase RidA (YjgF/YER057c/UK114 family)
MLRLKGNTGFATAASTGGSKELTRSTSGTVVGIAAVLASVTAALAAKGLVLETVVSIELLLTSGKDELLTTILTNQSLVFKHSKYPLFSISCRYWAQYMRSATGLKSP